jgi:hypothetical protein
MGTVAFIFFLFLWMIVSRTVRYWMTMAALGWKIETPEFFIRADGIYILTSVVLCIVTCVLAFIQKIFPWWIALLVVLAVWLFVRRSALSRGFSHYRQIHREMLSDLDVSEPDAEEQQKALEEHIVMSNEELRRRAIRNVKLGLN